MLVIAAKQFQMVVFMHDGAHGLIFKNRKLNDLVSQWLCAFPVMSDTLPYRKVHSQHRQQQAYAREQAAALFARHDVNANGVLGRDALCGLLREALPLHRQRARLHAGDSLAELPP